MLIVWLLYSNIILLKNIYNPNPYEVQQGNNTKYPEPANALC